MDRIPYLSGFCPSFLLYCFTLNITVLQNSVAVLLPFSILN
nr:MAG TPA: hypothetical protein [Caudoviricetes sp.]